MIRTDKTAARKSARSQRRIPRNFRRRVFTAFRELGHGVDERTAQRRTQAFFRSSGADWARSLG